MKAGVFIVGAMLMLAGCATDRAGMRIDGSSQERTKQSLKQMSEAIPAQDRCRLQAAILRIQLGDTSSWKAGKTEQDKSDPLGGMINGMTFQQIIELSQRYPDKVGNTCNK